MWRSLAGRLAAAWREFVAEMVEPYRPELHAMPSYLMPSNPILSHPLPWSPPAAPVLA